MPIHYFYKELFANKFIVGGKAVSFEPLIGNCGVIAIDDAVPENKPLIDGLDFATNKGIGGIVRINGQEYEDKKKALPPLKFDPYSRHEKLRVLPAHPNPFDRLDKNVAAVEQPAPSPTASAVTTEAPAAPAAPEVPAKPEVNSSEDQKAQPGDKKPAFRPAVRRVAAEVTEETAA